jgi:hypothetical protein
MNKTDIIEIMSERITKLVLFSIVFVGMMVVLVPMLVEEVDARINAKATSLAGPFSDVRVVLTSGSFWTSPRQPAPNIVTWETWGGPPFGGRSEIGSMSATVGSERFTVHFSNPRLGGGPNSCDAGQDGFTTIRVSCHITSGLFVAYYYSYPQSTTK